jgi:TolA-binding protein
MKAFFFIFTTSFTIFIFYRDKDFSMPYSASYSLKSEKYYYQSLQLAKKNRELMVKVSELNHELNNEKTKNHYLKVKMDNEQGEAQRDLASFMPVKKLTIEGDAKDYVQYDIYKWGEQKLFSIGNREYKLKNYDKASQFYVELINQHPDSKHLTESMLMKSAFSCYQSKKYYSQAIDILDMLLKRFPHSEHYLKAKLWRGLSELQLGNFKKFFASVDEFRKKYRNTREWAIIRNYYEKIIVKSEKF